MTQLDSVRALSAAVLYEGCMLYPYRPSALKNQRLGWTFGALLPPAYVAANPGELDHIQAQVLTSAPDSAELLTEIHFLQIEFPSPQSPAISGSAPSGRPERLGERCLPIYARMGDLLANGVEKRFTFPVTGAPDGPAAEVPAVEVIVQFAAERLGAGISRITLGVRNVTRSADNAEASRDAALKQAPLNVNALITVGEGEFISLLDPPGSAREAAAACRQVGVFPVMAGDSALRNTMLISPIILYDYPQIAPESRGDLFDSSEIDELLSLRILTLTEAERNEMKSASESGRELLERTDALSERELAGMHGAFRDRGARNRK